MSAVRHNAQVLLVTMALTVFASGSALLGATWLGIGTSGDTLDVRGFGLILFWPLSVLGFYLCGFLGLLLAGRYGAAALFSAGALALLVGGFVLMALTIGLPALAGVALLAVANAVALTVMRRWLLRPVRLMRN